MVRQAKANQSEQAWSLGGKAADLPAASRAVVQFSPVEKSLAPERFAELPLSTALTDRHELDFAATEDRHCPSFHALDGRRQRRVHA
jgi:hypothetical protein